MSDHSITQWIDLIGSDNRREAQDAARRIWSHFSSRLLELARQHLSARVRAREDEEDVLQSMYKSFVIRQQRGDFSIDDRDDLWRLLVTMTENKARNVAIKHGRGRRDHRKEMAGSGLDGESTAPSPTDIAAAPEPTPEEAAILAEELKARLEMLPVELREVALRKLEGYSNADLAGKRMMDCAERTIERKLNRIRVIWEVSEGISSARGGLPGEPGE